MAIDQTLAESAVAVHSYGTRFFINFFQVQVPDIFVEFKQLTKVTYSDQNYTKVDITHLLSPGRVKEYMPGFLDAGKLDLTFNFSPVEYDALRSWGTIDPGDITYDIPDLGRSRIILMDPIGGQLVSAGYLEVPAIEVPEDGEIVTTVTFQGSGGFTYIAP